MSVSIIIPVVEKYELFAAKAEESALNQSMGCHVWLQNANDINVARATNLGALTSQSKYLMRLDCDDFLHPMAADIMSRYMDSRPNVVAVYSDYWTTNEDCEALDVTIQTAPPHPGCMLIRREAFEAIGGFNEDMKRQEGTDFYYRLRQQGTIRHIELPLWYYRQHSQQMSNAHNEVIKARHEVKELHSDRSEKILAIIPARGGSKGIPRKNLIRLNGVPLVTRAIRMAKKSKHDILIAVSTEDDEIREKAEAEGVTIIRRDPEDAEDNVNLITVAKHGMEDMDHEFPADIVVTIQPTAPFTPVEALDSALTRMLKMPGIDAIVSVCEVLGKHPFRMYSRVDKRRYEPFFPHTSEKYLQKQDRDSAYQFTGGFYIRRRRLLEEWDGEGFALGNWEGEEVPPQPDIDNRFDLLLAEAMMEKGL